MKDRSYGLSSILYTEWMRPIADYYLVIKKNEAAFEIIAPAIIAGGVSLLYYKHSVVYNALDGLAEILPAAISILIGFTVMLVTLLLTSSNSNMDKLKIELQDKILHNKKVSLYQELLIQFSHSLFSEVMLLLIVFFYLFLKGLNWVSGYGGAFLGIEVYLTLNILLSIIRGIANLYFSFYNIIEENAQK